MIWAVWTKLRGVLEFIGLLDAPEKEEEQQPTRQPLERVVMTGEITGLVDNVGTIDNAVRFQIELHRHNFIIGDVVRYTMVVGSGFAEKVEPVEIIKERPQTVEIVGQIVERKGRVYKVTPGNITFHLDEVSVKFLPFKGDWVELQLREDEVVGLHPLRSKIVTGKVTKFSNGQGLINGYIYFTTSNYAIGCLAAVNNDVLCLAIESEQGHCSWRALTINELKMSRPTVNKPAINYVEEKDGINVQCQQIVIVEHESLVQTKVMIEFSNDYSIKSFHLENNGGQEIVYTSEENVGAPGIVYNLEIKGVFIGCSDLKLIWNFGVFVFCKLMRIEVILADFLEWNISRQSEVQDSTPTSSNSSELSNPRNNIIMPGVRQLKPYAFVPVILGQYAIPDDLKTKFTAIRHMSMNDQMIAMQRVVPCLEFELDFNNYKARLHSLLFLEELCLLEKIEMLSFDTLITKEFDHYVIELPCREESNLISQGDKVLAKKRWRGIEEINFEGGIWKVCNNQLHVRFHSDFDLLYDDAVQYKISMEVSRTTFRRKHQAIDVCHKHLESEILFPSRMVSKPPQVVITDENDQPSGTCKLGVPTSLLKEKIVWNEFGFGRRSKICGRKYSPQLQLERKLTWVNKHLNDEQKNAIRHILKGIYRPLPYIIFGPPGTGKTVTISELALQIISLIPESRVLLAAPSNSAVDMLALKMLDLGLRKIKMVRLISYKYAVQGRLPVALSDVAAVPSFDKPDRADKGVKFIQRELIGRHRLTFGTLGLLGILYNMGFPRGHFTHIVIDEIGQATEPESLIPMAFLDKDFGQMVLVGDPLQLGPVVMSRLATEYGLNLSLIKRLMETSPYFKDENGFPKHCGYNENIITKLKINYRSLPPIVDMYNTLFYNNELIAQVDSKDSREAKCFEQISKIFPAGSKEDSSEPFPILFHAIKGMDNKDLRTSYYNKFEAMQVVTYLRQLHSFGITCEEVGVITPYLAQVKEISACCNQFPFIFPKIGSVEEFQGQERNIILLSTVRSSLSEHQSSCSFIGDPARINVSISRAKSALIICGDPDRLSEFSHWRFIIELCQKHKTFVGCPFFNGRAGYDG